MDFRRDFVSQHEWLSVVNVTNTRTAESINPVNSEQFFKGKPKLALKTKVWRWENELRLMFELIYAWQIQERVGKVN